MILSELIIIIFCVVNNRTEATTHTFNRSTALSSSPSLSPTRRTGGKDIIVIENKKRIKDQILRVTLRGGSALMPSIFSVAKAAANDNESNIVLSKQKASSSPSSPSSPVPKRKRRRQFQKLKSTAKNLFLLSPNLTLQECAFIITLYLLVAIYFYHSTIEHWTIIDAIYFAITSFTTVGYGDLIPNHHTSQVSKVLLTALFAFVGVTVLGVTLSVLGSELLRAEMKAMEVAKRNANILGVMDAFDDRKNHNCTNNAGGGVTEDNKSPPSSPSPAAASKWKADFISGFVHRITIFSILILCGLVIGHIEDWPWYDSIYYSIVTLTTVGYGDVSPQTQKARLVAIFFIPLAVASAGQLLGKAIYTLLQKRRELYYQSQYDNEKLNLGDLDEMDTNHSGRVNQQEFIEFMLMKMELVDKSLLDDLHCQFSRLDVTKSGYLCKRDLEVMARRKLKEKKKKKEEEEDET